MCSGKECLFSNSPSGPLIGPLAHVTTIPEPIPVDRGVGDANCQAQGLLVVSAPPRPRRQRVGEMQFFQGKKTCSYHKTKSKCQHPHCSRPVPAPLPCCGSGHFHFLLLFLTLKAGPPESFCMCIHTHVSNHPIIHLKLNMLIVFQ